MKISTTLFSLIALMFSFTIAVWAVTMYSATASNNALKNVYRDSVEHLEHILLASEHYRKALLETPRKASDGVITWEDARKNTIESQNNIANRWQAFLGTPISPLEQNLINDIIPLMKQADADATRLRAILTKEDLAELIKFNTIERYQILDPLWSKLSTLAAVQLSDAQQEQRDSDAAYRKGRLNASILMVVGDKCSRRIRMAQTVSPISAFNASVYIPQTKPVVDANPKVIFNPTADLSAQSRAINPPYTGAILVADARPVPQSVPTIELSKYTWASSKEAFNEYTLAAARLQAEYYILDAGETMFNRDEVKVKVFRSLLQNKLGWNENGFRYSREEANNPFFAQAIEYIRSCKNGIKGNVPEYFKEKVRNFAVSYSMYVASYNAQKDVKDANEQLALAHRIITGIGTLVFGSAGLTSFLSDISSGSTYEKRYSDLLYKEFFSEMKTLSLSVKESKGGSKSKIQDSVVDINRSIRSSASQYFLQKLPLSESVLNKLEKALRSNLEPSKIEFVIE